MDRFGKRLAKVEAERARKASPARTPITYVERVFVSPGDPLARRPAGESAEGRGRDADGAASDYPPTHTIVVTKSQDEAIDLYGRDRIGPDDRIVLQFRRSTRLCRGKDVI